MGRRHDVRSIAWEAGIALDTQPGFCVTRTVYDPGGGTVSRATSLGTGCRRHWRVPGCEADAAELCPDRLIRDCFGLIANAIGGTPIGIR